MKKPGPESTSIESNISADFPFESKYLDVNNSKMHYIDVGEGDPILFLHGQPTSSYLWRNVIPHLSSQGRCIAVDLIGMGKSGKPDIDYSYDDHFDYLEKFIEKLKLKNITLVIHDWGSGLGFHYANMHRDNVKAIAFMEALYKPMEWKDFPSGYGPMFKMIRAPFFGWLMLSVANMFLKKVLPDSMMRKLTKEEDDYYKSSYPTIKSRKPVRRWPQELPINGKPKDVYDKIMAYQKWLKESDIPKLCIYVHPGAIVTDEGVEFIKNNFSNTKMVDIGEGLHFIQEDSPHAIGNAISDWYSSL